MNHIQLALFVFFAGAAFISGVAILLYARLNRAAVVTNRAVYTGEVLLLGSVVIYGQFMVLSLVYLYAREFLFAAVAVNYLWLLQRDVRAEILRFLALPLPRSLTFYVFVAVVGFFIFRNYFFMVDIDSHTSYLQAQKLWVLNRTSLVGSDSTDIRIFSPHFEDVIGALGITFFPQELLYSQLINIFFRVVAVLLVYGYTTYRFNSFYGLAASLLVVFNLHFYVSGANRHVLMNGALIALFFGAVYNFFECYRKADHGRFFVALLFLTQFSSNKYQSLYIFLVAIVLGCWIQPSLGVTFRALIRDKVKVSVLALFSFIALLWFIKNWLATGWPFMPMFAGQFHILNRNPEMEQVFFQLMRGATWPEFLKYNGVLFLWHGMRPAYWIYLSCCLLPAIFLGIQFKKDIPAEKIREFAYWLAASFFGIMGMSLICHTDPRQYVFVIGILAFSAVLVWDFLLTHFFRLQKHYRAIAQGLILVYSVQGAYLSVVQIGGRFDLPTMQQNVMVLADRLHTADVIEKYYPYNALVAQAFKQYPQRMAKAAYYYYINTAYSPYLEPPRPVVSLFLTSVVRWESYEKPELVIEDLKRHDIQYVLDFKDDQVVFQSPEEFARLAVTLDRFPVETLATYNLPPDLKSVDYSHFRKSR